MLECWAGRKGRIGQVAAPIVDVGTTRASSVRGWSCRPADGDCGPCDWPQPALCSLAEAISGSPSPGRAARRRDGNALRLDPTPHRPVGDWTCLPVSTTEPVPDPRKRSPCLRCGQSHRPDSECSILDGKRCPNESCAPFKTEDTVHPVEDVANRMGHNPSYRLHPPFGPSPPRSLRSLFAPPVPLPHPGPRLRNESPISGAGANPDAGRVL